MHFYFTHPPPCRRHRHCCFHARADSVHTNMGARAGVLRTIGNTSLFLGLHARADSVHAKMWTRSTLNNSMGRGKPTTNDNTRTSQLLYRIGPVGRFSENYQNWLKVNISHIKRILECAYTKKKSTISRSERTNLGTK